MVVHKSYSGYLWVSLLRTGSSLVSGGSRLRGIEAGQVASKDGAESNGQEQSSQVP